MIYFRNEDAEYIRWIASNDTGFVANLGTGRKDCARIHTPSCKHIDNAGEDQTHTILRPKACSHDRDELVSWVKKQGYFVASCGSCDGLGVGDEAPA